MPADRDLIYRRFLLFFLATFVPLYMVSVA
jgi:hypothetical protein